MKLRSKLIINQLKSLSLRQMTLFTLSNHIISTNALQSHQRLTLAISWIRNNLIFQTFVSRFNNCQNNNKTIKCSQWETLIKYHLNWLFKKVWKFRNLKKSTISLNIMIKKNMIIKNSWVKLFWQKKRCNRLNKRIGNIPLGLNYRKRKNKKGIQL